MSETEENHRKRPWIVSTGVQAMLASPRCHAHSRRTGKPCRNPAVVGKKVCRLHGAHGGALPGNLNALKHGRTSKQIKNLDRAKMLAECEAVYRAAGLWETVRPNEWTDTELWRALKAEKQKLKRAKPKSVATENQSTSAIPGDNWPGLAEDNPAVVKDPASDD